MIQDKHSGRVGLLAVLGASATILLSGCGGSTSNAGPAPSATPTIYGINPADGSTGSGLQFSAAGTDAKGNPTTTATGAITGALSSTAKPLEGTVPLGFPAGTTDSAVPASQAGVTFRAFIANGNVGNGVGAIVPSSVVLTSPEVTGFSQPLTFDSAGSGNGLNAGQYTTAAFALPFTTSGIHQFTASLSDVGGQTSSTTLGVVVVAPTDVALFLSSFDTGTQTAPTPATATAPAKPGTEIFNAITAGDIVQVDSGAGTGAYPSGYAVTTADGNGQIALFTTPGTHTVTEFKPDGKTVVQTAAFTLPATAAGTTIYAVPAPAATTTAAVSKPHLVKRH